jgi:hypothetical protein
MGKEEETEIMKELEELEVENALEQLSDDNIDARLRQQRKELEDQKELEMLEK